MGGGSPLSVRKNININSNNIPQLDGNISIESQSDISSVICDIQCNCCEDQSVYEGDQDSQKIPVHVSQYDQDQYVDYSEPPPWYEKYEKRKVDKNESKCNRKSIKRDNKFLKSESLPIISVSNVRSLIPKIENFKNDILERNISLSILSEVWEKVNCKKQQFELEKIFQMDGLKYISTPRITRRGGGAAIVANLREFSLEKIPVSIPHNLEVVWGLLRPKKESETIREIIVAALYSPPNYKKNSKLLDHLLSTSHYLLSVYPRAGLVIGGDKNNLKLSSLLSGIPRLRQIVSKYTHGRKILDVLLTNMSPLYGVPEIVPAVPPDNPQLGVASDHSTVVATPLTQDSVKRSRDYVTRTFRPLPQSGILEFGEWICSEDWSGIPDQGDPTQQVENFENIVNTKLDSMLPRKSVKINPNLDKPFYTAELKKLDRQVKREYRKHFRSEKYFRLKKYYDEKFRRAAEDYLEKNVRSMIDEDYGQAYQSLKKLGSQPGDCSDEGAFTLISHLEENLSTEESIERIAEHFAKISQEFPPLRITLLPDKVKEKVTAPINPSDLPDISDYEMYRQIRKSKKPRSQVPGDLPRRLIQEFSPELAGPAAEILRTVVKTGQWPGQWRVEYGIPLQKQDNPQNEDDLRVISLTSFFSKVSEQFVIDWLLQYVGDKIDWRQYGGTKGSSISHYLIDLVNFVLYNQDLKTPHTVIAAMIDFSKAFNRINHNLIITTLSEMGVPGWLLKIVMGFLEERELILRYKGCSSSRKSLPGGGPQGTKLGLFLFLILINAAGYQKLEKNTGLIITQNMQRRKPLQDIHLKYIDDLSLAEALNLKECLVGNPDPNPPRPFTYHERTNQVLPPGACQLQEELDKLQKYCQDNQMVINNKKCKVMVFNPHRKYAGMPRLTLSGEGEEFLQIVENMKLLGVQLRSDMRWCDNTDYICKKGFSRLWILRRLKGLGANQNELIDVYQKQVRPVLELAVPVWQSGITKSEKNQIERVQKCALYVILGNQYTHYSEALELVNCESLEDRRVKICEKFVKKSANHPKYHNWFRMDENSVNERYTRKAKKCSKQKYHSVQYRTERYKNSPLPYLTELLNTM